MTPHPLVADLIRRMPMVNSQHVVTREEAEHAGPELEIAAQSKVTRHMAAFMAGQVVRQKLIERQEMPEGGGTMYRLSLVILTPFELREVIEAAFAAGQADIATRTLAGGGHA